MTHTTRRMDDREQADGSAWPLGALRLAVGDGRWHVTTWPDQWYSTAAGAWALNGGEVFNGERWVPLIDWCPAVRHDSVVGVIRRPTGIAAK